jgi:hypothetical protein
MSEFDMFLMTLGILGLLAVYSVINRATRLRRDDLIEPSLTGNGYHFKRPDPDGLYSGAPPRAFADGGYVRGVPRTTTRIMPNSTRMSASAPLTLTPRMLEHVNIQRRVRGVSPLNREGFKNAVSHTWDRREVRTPTSTNDWLTYLIMYECLFADHTQSRCSGVGGITIDPSAPYHGQGGEFAGAGASGDWTTSKAALYTDALQDRMSGYQPAVPDPLSDPASFKGPDPYAALAADAYNIPDYSSSSVSMGSSSPPSDSSSSYSSSSDSGSSSSSDSSPSSPSDSGSSGGGGDGS